MKKKKTFEQEMMDTGRIPNIAAGVITIVYVIFFAGLSLKKLLKPSILAFFIIFILQFIIAPLTNKALTKSIANSIEAFKTGELEINERTNLLRKIMACPLKIGLQVFIVFIIGIGIWTSTFYSVFNISLLRTWLSFGSALLGAYIASLLAINYSGKLCSYYAKKIIASGINEKVVDRIHFFGLSSKTMYYMSTIIPIIFTNIITLLLFYRIRSENFITGYLLISMLLVTCVNAILIVILSKFSFLRLKESMNQLDVAFHNLKTDNIKISKAIPTDLSNEMSYIIFLINNVFERLRNILAETRNMGIEVQNASGNLSVSTQQTSATALEQSTSIKEVVTSMEDSDALEKNIINHVADVILISSKTSADVQEGFKTLDEVLKNMQEIQHSNDVIISGITGLKNSLKGIQEISELISNIADLTKIIAFNAELEAASIDNSNFNHVADDIRQLTENIVTSTHSIKANITDIHKTADELVTKSQEGTKKIDEGVEITTQLHNYFLNLEESAEETKSSSSKIQDIVNQQKNSQQQILITLRQLSGGLDDITKSTQNINSQAGKLDSLSHSLEVVNLEETR